MTWSAAPCGADARAVRCDDPTVFARSRGQGLYNRDNAVLERVLGNKGWAVMTDPELEAAPARLERDRAPTIIAELWRSWNSGSSHGLSHGRVSLRTPADGVGGGFS